MKLKENNLEKLNSNELFDLAEFIVTENFKHHTNDVLPKNYASDVDSIYKEEMRFLSSAITFVAKNFEGNIDGAIRVLKWNYADVLPIEKIFGINPIEIVGMSPLKPIWHIGRFAIKKSNVDFNLLKKLMVCAISPICESKNENAVAFAECDSKLLRVLKVLGIETIRIGASINYLGSETIPIYMDYNGLIEFYKKNKYLVSNEELLSNNEYPSSLSRRKVLKNKTVTYPLV